MKNLIMSVACVTPFLHYEFFFLQSRKLLWKIIFIFGGKLEFIERVKGTINFKLCKFSFIVDCFNVLID
jgi:hypothetical protein